MGVMGVLVVPRLSHWHGKDRQQAGRRESHSANGSPHRQASIAEDPRSNQGGVVLHPGAGHRRSTTVSSLALNRGDRIGEVFANLILRFILEHCQSRISSRPIVRVEIRRSRADMSRERESANGLQCLCDRRWRHPRSTNRVAGPSTAARPRPLAGDPPANWAEYAEFAARRIKLRWPIAHRTPGPQTLCQTVADKPRESRMRSQASDRLST